MRSEGRVNYKSRSIPVIIIDVDDKMIILKKRDLNQKSDFRNVHNVASAKDDLFCYCLALVLIEYKKCCGVVNKKCNDFF